MVEQAERLLADPDRLARYAGFLHRELPRAAAAPRPGFLSRRIAGKHDVLLRRTAGLLRPGAILEFGVYAGTSARLLARVCPFRKIHGFDSFEGFPQDGRPDWQLDFSRIDLPRVPANVLLHPGWFDETVPRFLSELTAPVALVHIDCDLYSSTRTVLQALASHGHLKPGLPIVFDELLNYDTHLWNEMLALFEVLDENSLGIRWTNVGGRVRLAPDALGRLASGDFGYGWEADRAAGFRTQAAVVLTSAPAAETPAPDDLVEALRLQTGRFRDGALRRA
ncbi:MAG: class I SAM-dependent methyltransferase [Pseudomonadota bacterium]